MHRFNPLNLIKEFAKGTTVHGYGGEEFGHVSGMRKKDMQRKYRTSGSYDETTTIRSKGSRKKR